MLDCSRRKKEKEHHCWKKGKKKKVRRKLGKIFNDLIFKSFIKEYYYNGSKMKEKKTRKERTQFENHELSSKKTGKVGTDMKSSGKDTDFSFFIFEAKFK